MVQSLPGGGKDQNVAVVDVGANVMNVTVLRNDQSVYTREQAFGGNQLTQDIVSRYGMSPEEAENAKRSGGLPDDFEAEVLRPFMENLSHGSAARAAVLLHLDPVPRVDHILLAGGSAVIPGLDEVVNTRAQVPTIVGQSVRRDADLAAHPAQAPDGRRAVADRRLRPRHAEVRPRMSARINLLPHREERRKRARQHFFVLAGGTARRRRADRRSRCTASTPRSIETQIDRNRFLKSEIAKLDKEIAEIKKLKDEIAALLARKQVIETLQTDRAQTVHLLDELVRQMPEGRVPEVGGAAGHARQPARLRAVERARLDADAQHRSLAVARQPRAWSRSGPANVDKRRVSEFNMNFEPEAPARPEKDGAKAAPAPAKRGEERLSHGDQFQRDRRGIQAHQLAGSGHLARRAEGAGAGRDPGGDPGGRLLRRHAGPDRGARARPRPRRSS